MAYEQDLADRVRELVVGEDNLVEQQMFGRLAFVVNGNMAVAASGQGGLLVRVDPAGAGAWIDQDRVTPMVMRGREMRAAGCESLPTSTRTGSSSGCRVALPTRARCRPRPSEANRLPVQVLLAVDWGRC